MEQPSGSPAPGDPAPLKYHKDFAKASPGEVILQAGDAEALCFHFPLTLLSALVSFFTTLPPPSASDTTHGLPLIPLHNTTSAGLHIFLLALRTTLTSDHISIPSAGYPGSVVDAAYIARLLDAPVVPRLLIDTLKNSEDAPDRDYFLEFAIWAICDVQHRLEYAAYKTGRPGRYIADVDSAIVEASRSHAPLHWLQLQDLQLRYSVVVGRFGYKVQQISTAYGEEPEVRGDPLLDCLHDKVEMMESASRAICGYGSFGELETAINRASYEIGCETCADEVENTFAEVSGWLEDFLRYIRVKKD